MNKAILIGNGFTSQILPAYQDECMMNKFKACEPALYETIDSMLQTFRDLPVKDEKHIIALLEKYGIQSHHYRRYFIEQNLRLELEKPHITAIETLLKTAHLFHHVQKFDYSKITLLANRIYYNGGMNGISAAHSKISIERLKSFINSYEYVFTTNFDSVLDDVYSGENGVFHLHGGFYYKDCRGNGKYWVERVSEMLPPEKACLVWGRNAEEKERQTHSTFSFPISFPFMLPLSILQQHLNSLKTYTGDLLEIWGYSGLNDGHINDAIRNNTNIGKIIYYGDPARVHDPAYVDANKKLFCNDDSPANFCLKPWDEIWNNVK